MQQRNKNRCQIKNSFTIYFRKLMNRIAILLLLVSMFLFACDKENSGNEQTNENKTCFKGRYVGEGCWPIIQALEPFDTRFNNSQWQNRDSVYEHCVGTGSLPEKYKDGRPFYFTVDSLLSDPVHTMHCNTATYFAVIKSYSDNACTTTDHNN